MLCWCLVVVWVIFALLCFWVSFVGLLLVFVVLLIYCFADVFPCCAGVGFVGFNCGVAACYCGLLALSSWCVWLLLICVCIVAFDSLVGYWF